MSRIGRVLRAHGLRGELHVQLFRPRRDRQDEVRGRQEIVIAHQDGRTSRHRLKNVRWISASAVVLRLEGVDDRTAAEALHGAFIDIDPKSPPDALADESDRLVGAIARDAETQKELGRVIAIEDNGAQALLLIEDGEKHRLVPHVPAFIAESKMEHGECVVLIRTIPGLFDDDGHNGETE